MKTYIVQQSNGLVLAIVKANDVYQGLEKYCEQTLGYKNPEQVFSILSNYLEFFTSTDRYFIREFTGLLIN